MSLTLEEAKKMIAASEKKAKEMGVTMVIAVCDNGGHLIALHKQDGALLVSIEVAINKAYTAVVAQMPTHELKAIAQPGTMAFGIHACRNIIIFGGGLPVKRDDKIIGGIGVSGATAEQDAECAQAGIDAL